jgi:hypothetical protein
VEQFRLAGFDAVTNALDLTGAEVVHR